MSEHRACPFCGAAWEGSFYSDGMYDPILGALCDACCASGPPVHLETYASIVDAECAAIQAWDQREEEGDDA